MRGSFLEAFPPAHRVCEIGTKDSQALQCNFPCGGFFCACSLQCAPDNPVEPVCTTAGVIRQFWPVKIDTGAAHRTIHGFGSHPTPAAAGLLAPNAKRRRPAQPSFGCDLCRVMDRFRRRRWTVRGPYNFVPDCTAL